MRVEFTLVRGRDFAASPFHSGTTLLLHSSGWLFNAERLARQKWEPSHPGKTR